MPKCRIKSLNHTKISLITVVAKLHSEVLKIKQVKTHATKDILKFSRYHVLIFVVLY